MVSRTRLSVTLYVRCLSDYKQQRLVIMFQASVRPPLSQQSHECEDENEHVEMITTWGNRITPRNPYPIASLPNRSHKD